MKTHSNLCIEVETIRDGKLIRAKLDCAKKNLRRQGFMLSLQDRVPYGC